MECEAQASENEILSRLAFKVPTKRPPVPDLEETCKEVTLKKAKLARKDSEKLRRDRHNYLKCELAKNFDEVSNATEKVDKLSVLRLTVNRLKLDLVYQRNPFLRLMQDQSSHERLFKHCSQEILSTLYRMHDHAIPVIIDFDRDKYCLSEKAKLLFTNRRITDFLGHSLIDVLGQSLFRIIHPADNEVLHRQLISRRDPYVLQRNPILGQVRFEMAFQLRLLDNKVKHSQKQNRYNVQVLRFEGQVQITRIPSLRTPEEPDFAIHFIGIAYPCPNPNPMDLPDQPDNQWITRHSLSGSLIFSQEKSCLISGYTPSELKNVSPYQLILPEDVLYVVKTHIKMLQGCNLGNVCFRMMVKGPDKFVYAQSFTHFVHDSTVENGLYINCIMETLDLDEDDFLERVRQTVERLHLNDIPESEVSQVIQKMSSPSLMNSSNDSDNANDEVVVGTAQTGCQQEKEGLVEDLSRQKPTDISTDECFENLSSVKRCSSLENGTSDAFQQLADCLASQKSLDSLSNGKSVDLFTNGRKVNGLANKRSVSYPVSTSYSTNSETLAALQILDKHSNQFLTNVGLFDSFTDNESYDLEKASEISYCRLSNCSSDNLLANHSACGLANHKTNGLTNQSVVNGLTSHKTDRLVNHSAGSDLANHKTDSLANHSVDSRLANHTIQSDSRTANNKAEKRADNCTATTDKISASQAVVWLEGNTKVIIQLPVRDELHRYTINLGILKQHPKYQHINVSAAVQALRSSQDPTNDLSDLSLDSLLDPTNPDLDIIGMINEGIITSDIFMDTYDPPPAAENDQHYLEELLRGSLSVEGCPVPGPTHPMHTYHNTVDSGCSSFRAMLEEPFNMPYGDSLQHSSYNYQAPAAPCYYQGLHTGFSHQGLSHIGQIPCMSYMDQQSPTFLSGLNQVPTFPSIGECPQLKQALLGVNGVQSVWPNMNDGHCRREDHFYK